MEHLPCSRLVRIQFRLCGNDVSGILTIFQRFVAIQIDAIHLADKHRKGIRAESGKLLRITLKNIQ